MIEDDGKCVACGEEAGMLFKIAGRYEEHDFLKKEGICARCIKKSGGYVRRCGDGRLKYVEPKRSKVA